VSLSIPQPNLSLVADTLADTEPKSRKRRSKIKKSKSAIFSRQREVRFRPNVFPGQTIDKQLADAPGPNSYRHNSQFIPLKQSKSSANFMATSRKRDVFE